MSKQPVKKIKDDYPPLDDKLVEKDQAENMVEDENLKADLEDKQPAGDAGPEDAILPQPKKQETKY
jgi:hypothetical protein